HSTFNYFEWHIHAGLEKPLSIFMQSNGTSGKMHDHPVPDPQAQYGFCCLKAFAYNYLPFLIIYLYTSEFFCLIFVNEQQVQIRQGRRNDDMIALGLFTDYICGGK